MLPHAHRYTQSAPKNRRTGNHAVPLSLLLPKLVNGAALFIIVPAIGNILVVADSFLFQHTVVVAPFFDVVITTFAHFPVPLRWLDAGSLTVITDAAVVHASRAAASAAGHSAVDVKFFRSSVSYDPHDTLLLFFRFISQRTAVICYCSLNHFS
mgnify:FL=1